MHKNLIPAKTKHIIKGVSRSIAKDSKHPISQKVCEFLYTAQKADESYEKRITKIKIQFFI